MIGIVGGIGGSIWVPPVTYVWKSASSTSPAELYPGTTWARIKDRTIIAAGNIYAVGETGGKSSATLTTTEMPTHTHAGSTSSAGGHTHDTINSIVWRETTLMTSISHGTNARSVSTSGSTSTDGAHTHTITVGGTGEGKAFSVLMPYVVRYMWERIG